MLKTLSKAQHFIKLYVIIKTYKEVLFMKIQGTPEEMEQDIDDDLSDEEIERQIRELEKLQEHKRRRKEKDFEM